LLSSCTDRLDVVGGLIYLLNSVAEQQQLVIAALRHAAAQIMQLLQCHLRTVLLPLLSSPTAELPAVLAGAAAWSAFCTLLGDICVTGDGPSPKVSPVLLAVADSLEQQQQLFGLLLSFSKAVVYASQLPCVQSSAHSMLRTEALARCSNGLYGLVCVVGQLSQRQQGGCGSSAAVPWLLLLVQVMFAGSKLAVASAALAAAQREQEDVGLAVLQQCLELLPIGALCFLGATDDQQVDHADSGGGMLQQLQQQMALQLLPAMHNLHPQYESVQLPAEEDDDGSSSSSSSNNNSSKVELSAHVQQLSQQLQQWCMTYCGHFATSCCNNNPACTSMASSSGQELVGGKKCVCSRCVAARYCSRECQEVMWPYHKQSCKLKRQRRRQQQQQVVQQQRDQNAQ
jgi:hypothetical protein